jgi:hypothetical protein
VDSIKHKARDSAVDRVIKKPSNDQGDSVFFSGGIPFVFDSTFVFRVCAYKPQLSRAPWQNGEKVAIFLSYDQMCAKPLVDQII